ncbi:MAG: polysaccharide biosynthesis protein [Lachnospiraceae bacterium]|nr:polysaccharide biosynthesis protein [Lachnospiraceae bacterium]
MRKQRVTPLISGTLILTATGMISRIIGFFYRIFLSRNFGEEGMGIYQLLAPILALSFSFCVAGIQTAISKYVAEESSAKDCNASFHKFLAGTALSMMLSLLFSSVTYRHAEFLASEFLLESRCAPMLRIIALSIPFASMHSCVNGYFYGIKKTGIPAATQLAEQLARVGSVYLLLLYAHQKNGVISINCAVIGLVVGEIVSMLISFFAIYQRFYQIRAALRLPRLQEWTHAGSAIFSLALPLSANRIVLNFLQSIEAIQIPNALMKYGHNNSSALGIYGMLTGMALPLVLFPCALTNSLAVMLLPTISEAEAANNHKKIHHTISTTLHSCTILGIFSTALFLFFGEFLGNFLFSNKTVGGYIMTLSFICPFLYLSTTLGSILHGLGRTRITFCFSIVSLSIRLCFVFFLIPLYGIRGYLWGLLLSQLIHTFLLYLAVRRITRFT